MLDNARVHAALPATDLERARGFYSEKLRLTRADQRSDSVRFELGETSLLVFATPITDRGGHTQAGIEVADLSAAVADLRSRGVEFEEYDTGQLKTEDGVATEPDGSKAAWFKDSEGNLIVLVEFSRG